MAAKQTNRIDNDEAYVRFIMLETRGNAASLQQIAQAISQAVRPTIIHQQPLPPLPQNGPPHGAQLSIEAQSHLSSAEVEAELVVEPAPTRKSPPRKKKHRTPEVLKDIDLESGKVSFADFYQSKNPSEHSKRYLVIAAWFHLHRGVKEICSDHIYTCYRFLQLNVVDDVGSVFRACKKQGWLHTGSQSGWFEINHVGLKVVNTMRGE